MVCLLVSLQRRVEVELSEVPASTLVKEEGSILLRFEPLEIQNCGL